MIIGSVKSVDIVGKGRKMLRKKDKNINNDEKIKRLIYKYGFEAFAIMAIMLSILIYKNVLNGVSEYRTEYLVLAVGGLYFILRTVLGGLILLPDDQSKRKKSIKSIIFGNLIFGILIGLFTSVRNTYLYLDGSFNSLSLSIFLITAISAIVLGFVITGSFLVFSNYHTEKDLSE